MSVFDSQLLDDSILLNDDLYDSTETASIDCADKHRSSTFLTETISSQEDVRLT